MAIAGPALWALLSLGIILAGCELFTNGIEWFGNKLNLSGGAVGSVLAAVGTALPETFVPIVALIMTRGAKAEEIGIGGILGAPFMLSTLAFMMTGLAAIYFHKRGRRGHDLVVDTQTLGQDMVYFLVVYAIAIGLSFLPSRPLRLIGAFGLIGAYVVYVWRHFRRAGGADGEQLDPLYLHHRSGDPHMQFVLLQLFVSLVCVLAGAHLFVDNLTKLSGHFGISALVLSLIITPVATELPEKFNSVLWVSRGKDTLALGNITGAMVFQSCIPVLIGVLMTPWKLEPRALASAAVALFSVTVVFVVMRTMKRLPPYILLIGAPLYAGWLWFALRR